MLPMSSSQATVAWYKGGGALKSSPPIGADVWECTAKHYGLDSGDSVRVFAENAGVLLGRNTIQYSRRLPLSHETAWEWIANRERFGRWFLPSRGDFLLGGEFQILPV